MKIKKIQIINLILRLSIGGYFIYASYSKIIDPFTFIEQIRAYEMVPDPINTIMGLFLPWVELFCGIGMILGIFIVPSSVLISGMLLVFIIALSSAISRGLEINCGCTGGGKEDGSNLVKQLLIDIPMFLGSLFLSFYYFFIKKAKK